MRTLVVAHRGAAAEAPENTIAAFELALELGANALELDVRRSRDGVPVVIHDPTLERTTERRGRVGELAAAALGEIRVEGGGTDPPGGAHSEGAAERRIPRLEEVFDRYPGVEVTVDVKDPEATERVVDLIGTYDRVGDTVLYVERGTRGPAFRSYPGRRATSRRQSLWFAVVGRWAPGLPTEAFPEVLHTPLRRWGVPLVTPGIVSAARRSGRSVQAWTVDDPDRMIRLSDWGVERVVTNDVRGARAALDRAGVGRQPTAPNEVERRADRPE